MKRLGDLDEKGIATYLALLARATESVMPEGAQFALIVFDEATTARYVSNLARKDVIGVMRAVADQLERADIPAPKPKAKRLRS